MKIFVFTLAALLVCGALAITSAAPGQPSSMSGTLTVNSGKFFLTDEATRLTVEVRGADLRRYAGQKVSVKGVVSPGLADSPQVLTVSQISRAAIGGRAAAAGVKAGLSKAAVVGIAGAATAGTVGTLYAADVIGGEEAAVSRQ